MIRYLISQKIGTTYAFSHIYAKIKIDSFNSLHIEKTLTLHNVIMLIKPVFNKEENHYYYNIFLKFFCIS